MSESAPASESGISGWTWLALLAALVTSVGSMMLSFEGLIPCPLCYYQRTLAFGVFGVLTLGVVGRVKAPVSLLAMPLALSALGVAIFHVYLEMNNTLECPLGLFNMGSAPVQSLVALSLLTIILFIDLRTQCSHGQAVPGSFLVALLVGGLITFACIKSAPAIKAPAKPYPADKELKGCRPRYLGSEN